VQTGKLVHILEGHVGSICCIRYSPDGNHIISGSGDGEHCIKIWNVQTNKLVHTINGVTDSYIRREELDQGHIYTVTSICYSPDNKTFISGSNDTFINVWDASTYKLIHTLTNHTNYVWHVCYSPDSKYIASGSSDETIKVWDAKKYTLLKTLINNAGVLCICFTSDSERIISGDDEKRVKIWNIETGMPTETKGKHEDIVKSVCCSPDDKQIISGCYDGKIKIWDTETGECTSTLHYHSKSVHSVAYTSFYDTKLAKRIMKFIKN
jgi:WD40 repeat protein